MKKRIIIALGGALIFSSAGGLQAQSSTAPAEAEAQQPEWIDVTQNIPTILLREWALGNYFVFDGEPQITSPKSVFEGVCGTAMYRPEENHRIRNLDDYEEHPFLDYVETQDQAHGHFQLVREGDMLLAYEREDITRVDQLLARKLPDGRVVMVMISNYRAGRRGEEWVKLDEPLIDQRIISSYPLPTGEVSAMMITAEAMQMQQEDPGTITSFYMRCGDLNYDMRPDQPAE